MNLLFDLVATQPNGVVKRHGGGKYGEIIFFRMIERKIPFFCMYNSNLWLNPDVQQSCEKAGIPLIDVANKEIKDIVKEFGISSIYSCLPEHLQNVDFCKVVGTIHGLRVIETPFDYITQRARYGKFKLGFMRYVSKEINNSRREACHQKIFSLISKDNFSFITVSNHSKYSILSQFPQLQENQIKVFYSPSTASNSLVKKKENIEKYFLIVSANRMEKNARRGIEALDRLFSNNLLRDFKVVVTGANFPKDSYLKRLIRDNHDCFGYTIKNKNRFELKGYVSDKELETLYANAYALIYPSLNEGFGYPPLEAMHYGTPVVASSIASIPEICEDAALYFMPLSVEEIMNRLLMIANSTIHNKYSQLAVKQYKKVLDKQNRDLDRLIDYITSNDITD